MGKSWGLVAVNWMLTRTPAGSAAAVTLLESVVTTGEVRPCVATEYRSVQLGTEAITIAAAIVTRIIAKTLRQQTRAPLPGAALLTDDDCYLPLVCTPPLFAAGEGSRMCRFRPKARALRPSEGHRRDQVAGAFDRSRKGTTKCSCSGMALICGWPA